MKSNILVVDDEIDFHEILFRCYQRTSMKNQIKFFGSAKDVLKYMNGVIENKNPKPCLIISDVNMPIMNGFEMVDSIKKHDQFKIDPMIFMFSCSGLPEDIYVAKKVGANGYFEKSFEIETYVDFFNLL